MLVGSKMEIEKPNESEFHSFYQGYVDAIDSGSIWQLLEGQIDEFRNLLSELEMDDMAYAYEEGKWSIAELTVHMLDVERVMAYRMMCIARGDQQSLPGMDQDKYVAHSNAINRSSASIIEEFQYLRKANTFLINNFTTEDLNRRGEAWNCEFTVRALIYIMVGHFQHHLQILKDRYLIHLIK